MDSYLKQILKDPNLTPSEIKAAEDRIKELVIEQRATTRAMNIEDDEGNDQNRYFYQQKRNNIIDEKDELRNSLRGKATVHFKNKIKVVVDRKWASNLKDPKKYFEDKHIEATKRQIEDLKALGKTSSAKGLGNLLKSRYPENKKLKDYVKDIEKKVERQEDIFWDEILKGMDELQEIDYKPIYVVSGNQLKVIYARKKKG